MKEIVEAILALDHRITLLEKKVFTLEERQEIDEKVEQFLLDLERDSHYTHE